MTPWAKKQLAMHLDMNDVIPSDEGEVLSAILQPAGIQKRKNDYSSSTQGNVKQTFNRPEEDDGRALTTWMDLLVLPGGLRPGLYFYHVPNGLARNATMGGIFKAQGLRKGWPDYGLDLPLGRYHGARLELKSIDGDKPTREQLDHLARLEDVGFKCGVAWGFYKAKDFFDEYLDLAR